MRDIDHLDSGQIQNPASGSLRFEGMGSLILSHNTELQENF